MKASKWTSLSPLGRLALWFGIILGFGILFLVGMAFCISSGTDLSTVSAMWWLVTAQDIGLFILPGLIAAYIWSEQPAEWLHVHKGASAMTWLSAIVLMIVALPSINLISSWNQAMTFPASLSALEEWMRAKEEAGMQMTEKLLSAAGWGNLVINLLVVAILAAVSEEFCFRGVMQGIFSDREDQRTPHAAIWLAAIIFSAIHVQFYGFIPRMLIGALFGYALAWSGSLWVPIVMHCTNNAIVTLLYHLALQNGWDIKQMDSLGTADTLWLGWVSLGATMVGIYLLRRSTTMSKASSRTSAGN